jgi:phytoene dehydrogenase-like protein
MSKVYESDVVVIGAGQNGLVTAAYLAKAGLEVTVLEAQELAGGSVQTQEITAPGYRHDVAATIPEFAMGCPAITEDELGLIGEYGLEFTNLSEPSVVNVFDDGTALCFYNDLDKTCASIAQFSQHDAEAYRRLFNYLQPMVPLLGAGMYSAPPKMGIFFNQLDQTPIGQDLIRLLMMTAWDLANQWFEHPKTIISMMNYPTEAMVDPEMGGSALYVVTLVATQHLPGRVHKVPKGGIQTLTDSLLRCILANGGEVRCSQAVNRINTSNGRVKSVSTQDGNEYAARKAVISCVDPRFTFNEWIEDESVSQLKEKLSQLTEPAFSGIMTHVALDTDPILKAGGEANTAAQLFLLPSDLTRFRQYFYDMRLGKVPYPAKLLAILMSRDDKGRLPSGGGGATLYHWQFVPYFLADGGPEKWDEIREDVSRDGLERFYEYTTNISETNVIARKILSPLDYQRQNKNMVNGAVLGPSHALYQYMAYRPIPELGQYRTPIKGLYQGGQSTHPAGGVTLGGRATARALMDDLNIDFDDLF